MTLCIYIYICICTPVKFKLWNTKDYPCVKLELGQRAISYHTKNVPEQKALKPHRAITIHVRCILLHSQNRLEPMQQWGSLGLGLITNPRFQCCTCTEQLKGLGAWNRNVISDVYNLLNKDRWRGVQRISLMSHNLRHQAHCYSACNIDKLGLSMGELATIEYFNTWHCNLPTYYTDLGMHP